MIEIPLGREQISIVDDEDGDLLTYNWFAQFQKKYSGGGKYLAIRNTPYINGKKSNEYLHRAILSRMAGRKLERLEFTDHINGNTLDNRRCNLRIATPGQNQMNRGKRADNSSGFKCVFYHKQKKKWHGRFAVNGKRMTTKYFDTAEMAYRAYCEMVTPLSGEFANTGDYHE